MVCIDIGCMAESSAEFSGEEDAAPQRKKIRIFHGVTP